MMLSNLGKIYRIQGPKGPVDAKRPPDEALVELRRISQQGLGPQPDLGDRPAYDPEWRKEVDQWLAETRGAAVTYAKSLADAGYTVDAPVDLEGGDYWKVMEARRKYGYTWVPAGHMANIAIAPGLWMPASGDPDDAGIIYPANDPPQGAILVPRTAEQDPNFKAPDIVTPPPPPPGGQVVFGPPIEYGEFIGSFIVGANNTVPPGTHATKDGIEYVYIVIGKIGTLLYRKLWIPTGR